MFTKSRLTIFTFVVLLVLFGTVSISGAISGANAAPAIAGTATATPAATSITGWNAAIPNGAPRGTIGTNAILGTINTTTSVYFNPDTTDVVAGITLSTGSRWFIVGVTGNFYQLALVNVYVYVPKSVVTTN